MIAPTEREVVRAALEAAGIDDELDELNSLAGGCIHRVLEIRCTSGMRVVVKIAAASRHALLEEECAGLHALAATRTVCVPDVLSLVVHGGQAAMVTSFVEPPSGAVDPREQWETFGRELALLHQASLPVELGLGFGFNLNNHIGLTPQPNAWTDDWIEFNRVHRLGFQLQRAASQGLISAAEQARLQLVIAHLKELLPSRPRRSLLHGDLWSGNVLPCTSAIVHRPSYAIIDPAPSIGEALADVAMLSLFGGVPKICFDTWAEAMQTSLDNEDVRRRLAVYQLYHVLNHVNLFGRSYISQALGLAGAICGG